MQPLNNLRLSLSTGGVSLILNDMLGFNKGEGCQWLSQNAHNIVGVTVQDQVAVSQISIFVLLYVHSLSVLVTCGPKIFERQTATLDKWISV